MRVVGFQIKAIAYRNTNKIEFIDCDEEQLYNFEARKENCILLPNQERHANNNWYVPSSGRNNSTFGF